MTQAAGRLANKSFEPKEGPAERHHDGKRDFRRQAMPMNPHHADVGMRMRGDTWDGSVVMGELLCPV